jgi:hypothetical protein
MGHIRKEFLAPDGHALISVPLGYNPHLDRLIRTGQTGYAVHFLRRVNENNDWQEVEATALDAPEYDSAHSRANAIAILSTY